MEISRKNSEKEFIKYTSILTIALILSYFLSPFILPDNDLLHLTKYLIIDGGIVIWMSFTGLKYSKKYDAMEKEIQDKLIQAAKKQYGEIAYSKYPQALFDARIFTNRKLINPFIKSITSEMLKGEYNNQQFEFSKTNLFDKQGRKLSVHYIGFLIKIQLSYVIDADIVIYSKKNIISQKLQDQKFKSIGFKDISLGKDIKIYGSTKTKSDNSLNQEVLNNLSKLINSYDKKGIMISIFRDEVLVKIPTTMNIFANPSFMDSFNLMKPIKYTIKKDSIRILNSMTIPHRIIDCLNGKTVTKLI